jgi:hypothetical protein
LGVEIEIGIEIRIEIRIEIGIEIGCRNRCRCRGVRLVGSKGLGARRRREATPSERVA